MQCHYCFDPFLQQPLANHLISYICRLVNILLLDGSTTGTFQWSLIVRPCVIHKAPKRLLASPAITDRIRTDNAGYCLGTAHRTNLKNWYASRHSSKRVGTSTSSRTSLTILMMVPQ